MEQDPDDTPSKTPSDDAPSWEQDTQPTAQAADAAPSSEPEHPDAAAPPGTQSSDAAQAGEPEHPDAAEPPVISGSVSAFDLLPQNPGGFTGPTATPERRAHPPTGPDNEIVTNVVDGVPIRAAEHSGMEALFGDLTSDSAGDGDADAGHAGRRRTVTMAGSPGPRRSGPVRGRARRRDRGVIALCVVVALLALVALFVFGTRMPTLFGYAAAPAPTHSSTPTPTPTPTVTPVPEASHPDGVSAWDALGGGECLAPFDSPWAEKFTVVDCSDAHQAQLVSVALLSTDVGDAYPGADKVAQTAQKDCDQNGIIDLDKASDYADLQVQASYPATEEQWEKGERAYYCFASRSSGDDLTGSVAGPGPSR